MMETETGAICTICGYANKNSYLVRRHLLGKHSTGPGYRCPVCKKNYKTESIRQNHMLKVHKKSCSVAELRLFDSER